MPNSPRQQFEENWRKRFEKFASSSNDDAGVAGWSSTGLETRLRFFRFLWEQQPTVADMLWLDVGCGAGTYSRFLTNCGMRVVGMDYSMPALQKAVLNASSTPIIWCAADATKLPVKQNLFNGVLCFGVVQALSSSDQLITELTRCVKPGGQVWVDALNGQCLPHAYERFFRWLRGRPLHLRYETYPRLRDIMQKNDLTEIELFWLPMLPTRWYHFQWLLETPAARWLFQHIPGIGVLFSHAFLLRGRKK